MPRTRTTPICTGAAHDRVNGVKKAGSVVVVTVATNGHIVDDYKVGDLSNVPAYTGGCASSTRASRMFGMAVGGVKDLNRDGYHDIFVGAPGMGY